jgi:threonine dehydratase
LAGLLSDIRPRPPRKPRRRTPERLRSGQTGRAIAPNFPHTSLIATAVEETPR